MRLGLSQGLSTGGSMPLGPTAVSNSKSLAFDGSDQHLTTAADSTLATKTYSWWAQSADTGLNVVFDHGSANKGGFMFNGSSGRPLLYLADNYYRYFDDTSCQDDGSWHHWLVLLTTDVSNSRLFCDGVEVSANSTSTSDGAGLAYSTGIRLGRGGSYYFSGHLDEFAIFDGDKTGIVADLYNSGVPTNLASTAGLEHWWRMGDATEPAADGTTDNTNFLIFDQVDTTVGSNLVTNGDFASGNTTGWTLFGADTQTVEVATNAAGSNAAHLVTDGTYASIYQALTPASGTVLKLSFDVQVVTGALVVADGTNTTNYGTTGSYVRYITSDGHVALEFKRSAGSTEFYVDNVSVQAVNGATATMTNMATSDIVQYTPNSYILSDLGITPDLAVSMTRKLVSDYDSDLYVTSGSDITAIFDQSDGSLGSNLVYNGDFSSDVSGWTKDGDASSTIGYDSGRLKVTAATNYDGASQSVGGLVAGQTYKFSADYEFGTATQLQIRAGSEPSTDLSSPSSGTAVNYFVADSTSMTIYVRTGGSTGTIFFDNISVKKVNGKHLTNWDNQYVGNDAQLAGSGNSARATFSSVDNTVLTTSTLGSAFPAGNHDVFMVFDPVGTDQQILFGRASTGGDFLAMDNGSSSDAASGITIGEIRVNDTILPATVSRDELWDAMTVSGTMDGLNVLSLEDVDLSSIGGDIRLGSTNNTWRLEGAFAEFIITPPLTDAEHSAIVENIRAHYDAP